MTSPKCDDGACVYAWLFESDPDDLQQALAREQALRPEASEGEAQEQSNIGSKRRPSKAKEDYRLLVHYAGERDEYEHQTLVSRILERFAEQFMDADSTAEEESES